MLRSFLLLLLCALMHGSESLIIRNTTRVPPVSYVVSHMKAIFGPDSDNFNITTVPTLAPDHLCDPTALDGVDFEGSIVVVQRGNCNFYDKALLAQQHNASVVVVGNTEDGLISMYSDVEPDLVEIPAVLIRASAYNFIAQAARAAQAAADPVDTLHSQAYVPADEASGVLPLAPVPGLELELSATGAIDPNWFDWRPLRLAAFLAVIMPAVLTLLWFALGVARAAWRARVLQRLTVDVAAALPVAVYVAGGEQGLDWGPLGTLIEEQQAQGQVQSEVEAKKSGGKSRKLGLLSPPSEAYSELDSDPDASVEDRRAEEGRSRSSSASLVASPLSAVLLVSPATARLLHAHPLAAAAPLPALRTRLDAEAASAGGVSGARVPSLRVHNGSCSVCLEDFASGELVKLLPCRHAYHPDCIDAWLSSAPPAAATLQHDLGGPVEDGVRAGSATVLSAGARGCPICKRGVLEGVEQERWAVAPWWVKLYRVMCACEPCNRRVVAR